MAESLFVRADEVIRLLGVSKSEAYRIIKRLNDEMASKVVVMATAGGTLNLTEIFKTDLTGATVSGDFTTMVTDNNIFSFI